MIANTIEHHLEEVLKKLSLSVKTIHLEHPAVEDHGDYSTNVALAAFPNLTNLSNKTNSPNLPKNPREFAQLIVEELQKDEELKKIVDRINVAGSGFINFFLKSSVYTHELANIAKEKAEYGKNQSMLNKKIVVEYTDPNPFKELHIGHLYSNVIGESIAKLLEASGAVVWRADFYGDVGVHTAKAVWGMKQKLKADGITLSALAQKNIDKRQEFMGQAYAYGAVQHSENKQAAEEMNHLNTLIYAIAQDLLKEEKHWKPLVNYHTYVNAPEFNYEEIKEIYKNGLKWSLEYFETLYKMLGTKFDGYYPESLVGEYGYQMVMEGLGKGIFERSEGAVIFRGVHTRVFINKNNLPTYEAKDLGLALAKYNDFAYDLDINVTGNEIKEYFKVVIPALTAVRPDLGSITTALSTGMVNLPEGKMSSRSGNVITVEGLFDTAAEHAIKLFTDGKDRLTKQEKIRVARIVGMAAIRYAFLKSTIGNDIAFSFKDSVTFDGNSGPYLQYTYARCQSVLEKAGYPSSPPHPSFPSYLPNTEERSVLRWIYRFPEIVMSAAEHYAPNEVCTFLYELAQRFNTFYNKHRILDGVEDPHEARSTKHGVIVMNHEPRATSLEQRQFRLALTAATGQVLKNGLKLLGIQAPEKM